MKSLALTPGPDPTSENAPYEGVPKLERLFVVRRKRRPRFLPEAPRKASSRTFGDVEDAMIEWLDERRRYWAKKERRA